MEKGRKKKQTNQWKVNKEKEWINNDTREGRKTQDGKKEYRRKVDRNQSKVKGG